MKKWMTISLYCIAVLFYISLIVFIRIFVPARQYVELVIRWYFFIWLLIWGIGQFLSLFQNTVIEAIVEFLVGCTWFGGILLAFLSPLFFASVIK